MIQARKGAELVEVSMTCFPNLKLLFAILAHLSVHNINVDQFDAGGSTSRLMQHRYSGSPGCVAATPQN